MRRWLFLFSPVAIAIALSACNQGTQVRHEKNLFVGYQAGAPDQATYSFGGRKFASSEKALEALVDELESEMKQVPVEATPLAGSLRILILPVEQQFTGAQANNLPVEIVRSTAVFRYVLSRKRADAIQHSGIFRSVTKEIENAAIPANDGHDFVMWQQDGNWKIKNTADLSTVVESASQLQSFISNMKMSLGSLDKPFSIFRVVGSPRGPIYLFGGKEFMDLDEMETVLTPEVARYAATVAPRVGPLGGRAMIVIPASSSEAPSMRHHGVHARLMASLRAELLKASGLFDSVVIERANVADVPIGEYDWVLWVPATAPFAWRYRLDMGDAYAIPQSPVGIQGWAESVRAELAARKAALRR